MRATGFTLLEVVVTLAIVIALSAVVVPSVSGRLGGESASAVMREIRAGVAMGRTDAIRDSEPRRVVFVTDAGGRVTRLVSRGLEKRGAIAPVPRFVGPILDDPAPVAVDQEDSEVVLLELPRGTRVSRRAPVVEGLDGATADRFDPEADWDTGLEGPDPETWDQERGESAVTLGVLLPTGAAVGGATVFVTLPGGVTLEAGLDAWTGGAIVTRWIAPSPEGEWDNELGLEAGADAGIAGREASGGSVGRGSASGGGRP